MIDERRLGYQDHSPPKERPPKMRELPFRVEVSPEEYEIILGSGPEQRVKEIIAGKEVLSLDEFQDLIRRVGFKHFKAGTYRTDDKSLWLYAKRGFYSLTLEQARADKAVAEALTDRGVVFPGTQWGIYKTEVGNFHLFATARGLDPFYSQDTENFKFIPPMDELCVRAGITDSQTHEFSPHGQFFGNFNYKEATKITNWGYSKELGQFFPIDMEVIQFRGSYNRAAQQKETETSNFRLEQLTKQDPNI